ncbi:MAG: potassium/proton antiporter [Bacteroidales bacterium]|nr:potassium/proton antiporter [Bacteroidales bacterium]
MIPLSVFSVNLLSENLLLLASILVFMAILVTKVGSKLGAPALLFFLLLGMAVGQDGLGVKFDDYELAESIGHFAMSVILFTAGLETSMPETKPVMWQAIMLSTLGVLLTVLITGGFMSFFGIPIMACFLIAAILSSTDSASVFSVLHEKKLRLKENLGPMLELESGNNDPIALTLTAVLVQFFATPGLQEKGSWAIMGAGALMLLIQLGAGVAIGFLTGYGAKWVLGKFQPSNFALTAILILSIGFFANGLAQLLLGNGLLATYICAIIIGNNVKLANTRDINKFFDSITWMMQLVMFMLLGLLARPSQMGRMILPAFGLCVFMILIARPLSVFVCTLPFKGISFRAKAFVSWVGLKGAGPILFALYALVHGLPYSQETFSFVFLFALFSLLLQGGTLSWVAKKLKVTYDAEPVAQTFGMEVPEEMGKMRDHVVTEADLSGGASLRAIHLPHGIRVMMVRRDGKFLVPHGSMELIPGDHLIIIEGESDD